MKKSIKPIIKEKTVGSVAFEKSFDDTKYKSDEIGYAMVEDNSIEKGLLECIEKHNKIFDEDEYCVGYVIASDPLIRGVMRRKFFAMLYLPSPRPEQTVFLYNKKLNKITHFLWCLPSAFSPNQGNMNIPEHMRPWTMERLYVTSNVPKKYKRLKMWTQWFYDGKFWDEVRKYNKIKLLSEHEYLQANREKLVQACADQNSGSVTNSINTFPIVEHQLGNA